MKKNKSFDTGKAQYMVASAMEEMSRATKKVLVDYLSRSFIRHFAKAIAYLEVGYDQAYDILGSFYPEIRDQIIDCSTELKKNDKEVIEEVEQILTKEGMKFNHDYQIIKENLLLTGQDFAEENLKKFRSDMPIFQDKLNNCIFNFEDIVLLDNRSIQKVLRDTDQQELAKALKGVDTEVQDKIFGNMSKLAASMLKEDMEFMGPVRLEDVEAAQAKIVRTIFQLEDKGDISIARMTVGKLIE
ncbi:MAG: hypothetical protein J5710_15455 [Treponema sp.]|nr:hypothetical protein [Treponema sp.]